MRLDSLKMVAISLWDMGSNFTCAMLITIFWDPGGLYLFSMMRDCCAKVHLIADPAITWSYSFLSFLRWVNYKLLHNS